MRKVRLLGIDPGMKRLGLAVVEIDEDSQINLITHGLISNPRDNLSYGEYLNASIGEILNDFSRFLGLTNPDIIAAERVPPGRLSANSELVVTAITVCKVIAYQWDISWMDLAANSVKLSATGDGLANKTKVRNAMLDMFSKMKETHEKIKREQKKEGVKAIGLPQDVFDALAVAICGAKMYEKDINERSLQDTERSL